MIFYRRPRAACVNLVTDNIVKLMEICRVKACDEEWDLEGNSIRT